MTTLRDYQAECVEAILKEWNEVDSTLAVLPTGAGKTQIFCEVINRRLPGRALVVAHRAELIYQAADRLKSFGIQAELEMAAFRAEPGFWSSNQVVVTTVQTQCAGRDGGRMTKFNPMDFDTLVLDECHHGTADTYKRIMEYYRQNPKLKILGVTATPDRTDEEALGQVFQTVAYDYEILDAINGGWLVPVQQQLVTIEGLDFSHMRTTAGDLNGADLSMVMEAEKNMQGVASASLEIIGEKKTLVFTASVKQSEMLCEIFNRHRQGMAAWISGKTEPKERGELLRKFSRGDVQVMVNCAVLTEGYDEVSIEVIIQAKPTKSRALYSQMVGRAMRPLKGVVDGLETQDQRLAAIAASPKPCIAEGSLILTDQGLVPVEKVTSRMMVWDGIDFVTNCGTIFRGYKQAIEYENLIATEDHEVWTSEGWKTFGECASKQIAISVAESGGKEIREIDGYFRGGVSRRREAAFAIHHDGMRLWDAFVERLFQSNFRDGRLPFLRSSCPVPEMVMEQVRVGASEMLQSEMCSISSLWRSWNKILFSIIERNGLMDSRESWFTQRYEAGQDRQRWGLRFGEYPICVTKDPVEQPESFRWPRTSCFQNCKSKGRVFRQSFKKAFEAWSKVERYFGKTSSLRPVQGKVPVFDILNSGPRHRFTAQGLLVSNCMLVVDFVGNAGRHKLMTTADILGGNVSEEAIKRTLAAASERGGPVNMQEELEENEEKIKKEIEEAKEREAARRARLLGKAKFSVRTINPFDVFGIEPKRAHGWDNGKTLSEKQTALLLRQGIDPTSMPYGQAKQVLNELFRRWDKKLATIKQCSLLQKHGYQTKDLTMDGASKLIDALAKNGWRRP